MVSEWRASPFTKKFLDIQCSIAINSDSSKPITFYLIWIILTFYKTILCPIFFNGAVLFWEDFKLQAITVIQLLTLLKEHFGTIKNDHGLKALYSAEYANEIVISIITSCNIVKLLMKKRTQINNNSHNLKHI